MESTHEAQRIFALRPGQIKVSALNAATIWNVHRSSVPGLGANECVLSGKWCFAIREANVSCGETDSQDLGSPLHGIPPAFAGGHQCARSSKRAGGFIPRIAL